MKHGQLRPPTGQRLTHLPTSLLPHGPESLADVSFLVNAAQKAVTPSEAFQPNNFLEALAERTELRAEQEEQMAQEERHAVAELAKNSERRAESQELRAEREERGGREERQALGVRADLLNGLAAVAVVLGFITFWVKTS